MTGLAAATAMLTRIPVPVLHRSGDSTVDPVAGAAWFPVVGAALGGAVSLALLATGRVLPALLATVLVTAGEVAVTGALHLDGLADCADGSAGRDRAHRLAIMRDHAIGVYGTAAVVLDLGLRVACLTALLELDLPGLTLVGVVVAAWTLSRGAMLLPALLLPAAREDGIGRGVIEGLTVRVAGLGLAVTAMLTAVAALGGALVAGDAREGVTAVSVATVSVLLVVAITSRWARSRLGGATGDVLGAVAELSLLAALVGSVVVLSAVGG